jgi:hypothetical protein
MYRARIRRAEVRSVNARRIDGMTCPSIAPPRRAQGRDALRRRVARTRMRLTYMPVCVGYIFAGDQGQRAQRSYVHGFARIHALGMHRERRCYRVWVCGRHFATRESHDSMIQPPLGARLRRRRISPKRVSARYVSDRPTTSAAQRALRVPDLFRSGQRCEEPAVGARWQRATCVQVYVKGDSSRRQSRPHCPTRPDRTAGPGVPSCRSGRSRETSPFRSVSQRSYPCRAVREGRCRSRRTF